MLSWEKNQSIQFSFNFSHFTFNQFINQHNLNSFSSDIGLNEKIRVSLEILGKVDSSVWRKLVQRYFPEVKEGINSEGHFSISMKDFIRLYITHILSNNWLSIELINRFVQLFYLSWLNWPDELVNDYLSAYLFYLQMYEKIELYLMINCLFDKSFIVTDSIYDTVENECLLVPLGKLMRNAILMICTSHSTTEKMLKITEKRAKRSSVNNELILAQKKLKKCVFTIDIQKYGPKYGTISFTHPDLSRFPELKRYTGEY